MTYALSVPGRTHSAPCSLRRRAVPGLDRPHRPARRRPRRRCCARSPTLLDALRRRDGRAAGPHGRHDARPRARRRNPFLQELAGAAPRERARSRPRAARSTCCPSSPRRGDASRSPRATILERGRLRADRDADVRGHRAVRRAASASRPTSSRRRCTRCRTAAGARSRCAPRAPRRSCRAYVEHGMHKLPQPVKLWYLSSFFRHERAQAGRYRQFWQVGAEAIGSDDPARRRRVDPAARRAARRSSASAACACASSSLGTPALARALPRAAAGAPARARGRAVRGRARAHRPQPAARVRLRPPGHARGDADARRCCWTTSTPTTPSTSRTVRELLDAAERRLRGRPDARARPRLLHAHGVRVHAPTRSARRAASAAAAATTASSSSSAGRRRPAWAGRPGVERILLAAEQRPVPEPVCDLFVALAGDGRTRAPPRSRCSRRGAPRRRAGADRARRALAQGPAQAGRAAAARATSPSSATDGHRAQGHGERRAGRAPRRRRPSSPRCSAVGIIDVIAAAAPERLPRHLVPATSSAERAGREARVAGWVHRRRDHGGLIFIDLRDRSGIVQLVFHPETSGRGVRARRAPALRARRLRRGRRSCAREEGNVNPNLPTGEIEIAVTACDVAGRERDAAVPDRRGHRRSTRRCA